MVKTWRSCYQRIFSLLVVVASWFRFFRATSPLLSWTKHAFPRQYHQWKLLPTVLQFEWAGCAKKGCQCGNNRNSIGTARDEVSCCCCILKCTEACLCGQMCWVLVVPLLRLIFLPCLSFSQLTSSQPLGYNVASSLNRSTLETDLRRRGATKWNVSEYWTTPLTPTICSFPSLSESLHLPSSLASALFGPEWRSFLSPLLISALINGTVSVLMTTLIILNRPSSTDEWNRRCLSGRDVYWNEWQFISLNDRSWEIFKLCSL